MHLASYRSQEAADRGWTQLRRAHRSLLDNLKAEISRVDLGPGKGIFWRVKAGPFKDEKQAAEQDYRWSSIISGVIHSAPFHMRRSKS